MAATLPEFLVCPRCRGTLDARARSVVCTACGVSFARRAGGYLDFGATAGGAAEASERLEAYASHQEASGERRYRDWLLPYLSAEPAGRVLDAGCGVGVLPALLAADGIDAYGVDLPKALGFWKEAGRDAGRFFCAEATSLPFADATFDLVLSLGVVEHIGTLTGHRTLAPDHWSAREGYAAELLRVVRPGGRVVVSCPNKSFPVDLHHGPTDAASGPRPVASWIAARAGLTVHPTWGNQHLLSFGEVRSLFRGAGAVSVRPLEVAGYFSFEGLSGRVPAPVVALARAYVEHLPAAFRDTALNPFVLAEIRR